MLNIPDEIKRFNHLKFMWGLGGMGEGYIPIIKKEIHNLREKCLHYNQFCDEKNFIF